jgi:23S rRNA (uracil1939-C5)-methyltransferase
MVKLRLKDSPIHWQQGELVEVAIADLNHKGEGVGRYEGRVVFVPDTVPGDRTLIRLVHVKPQYAYGKLHKLLEASPHRVRPSCIVADKCGGCQWQHIDYHFQLEVKRNLILQDLERIGGFNQPPVDSVLSVSTPLGYRNKATYPVQSREQGIENREEEGTSSFPIHHSPFNTRVLVGYYQKASHRLINLNQCPIQDGRLDPLLAEVKQDIQQRGWEIYDETKHRGVVRHLGLRIGRRTGEMLLTLVVKERTLPGIAAQAQEWCDRYPNLVGVCWNINPDRTNAIFGRETQCLVRQPFLHEEFAGLQFQIGPTTFFQVHTEQAEALLQVIIEALNLQGDEMLLDAYCGIGTLTLPLAKRVRQAIGLEIQPEAVEQAQQNAALNGITNATFVTGAVEELLPTWDSAPDIVLLDPPRKGCAPIVIKTLLNIQPQRIVYVSCNPTTLARDLKLLCSEGKYRLTRVQPADFFPQTAHVECAAFLVRS